MYCYARAYSSYPGDGVAVLYEGTPQRLERELIRAKSKPHAVYFSPSSDLFQPHPDIQRCAEEVLQVLFRHRVGVVFLSKGAIPEASMRLIESHAELVQAQVGLLSTDAEIARTFEPGAAAPLVRLAQMRRLVAAGVQTVARVDPILPGISDGDEAFDRLFSAIDDTGVRTAAAGILDTRPGIVVGLRRAAGPMARGVPAMLSRFGRDRNVDLRGAGTRVIALPEVERRQIIERASRHASAHQIGLRVCACKNPDIGLRVLRHRRQVATHGPAAATRASGLTRRGGWLCIWLCKNCALWWRPGGPSRGIRYFCNCMVARVAQTTRAACDCVAPPQGVERARLSLRLEQAPPDRFRPLRNVRSGLFTIQGRGSPGHAPSASDPGREKASGVSRLRDVTLAARCREWHFDVIG